MGARTSPEMLRARELLREGKIPAEAARLTGLTKGSISRDEVCREIIKERKRKGLYG